MACSECSGVDREPVAPGLWRCTSAVRIEHITWVPDGRGGRRPLVEALVRSCGHEYQEYDQVIAAAGLPLCACSTFAIGVCADCGGAVCGSHSRVCGGARRCLEHATAYDAEADRGARRAERDAEEGAANVARLGREYNRQWLAAFVASMKLAGSPGAVDLGNGARGWPYGRSSTHRRPDSSKLKWATWHTQSALSVDGNLGECRPTVRDTRRKRLFGRDPKRLPSFEEFKYLETVWEDFRLTTGITGSDNLRFHLRQIAEERGVALAEPAPPPGLPIRPDPAIGTVELSTLTTARAISPESAITRRGGEW